MEEALRQGNEQPLSRSSVGAVVVRDGEIIGRGCNRLITDSTPQPTPKFPRSAKRAKTIGNYRLSDCDLYVTIEPCAMCAEPSHARIRRLIYGADDPKAGAVKSAINVLNHPQMNHQVEITSGVLAGRSMELLQSFFRERRKKSDEPAL